MEEDEFNSLFSGPEGDDADEPSVEETTVEETVEEAAPETGETVAEEPVQTTVTEAPVEEEKDRHSVPVTALLDERDKRKEAQKRAEELERRIAEFEAREKQPVEVPDPYVDPDKYHEFMEAEIERRITQRTINANFEEAKEKHGEDVVQQAIEWGRTKDASDPAFGNQFSSQARPIEWLVRQHKRHLELSEFETDREAFIRREYARLAALDSTAAPTAIPAATAAPLTDGVKNTAPKSLASAPSATKATKPLNDADDFNSIFDKSR